jgi:hypothetical protein
MVISNNDGTFTKQTINPSHTSVTRINQQHNSTYTNTTYNQTRSRGVSANQLNR